jgi:hypothetical protein
VPGADALRFRLEHFAIPTKDQVKRAAQMPVVVSIQPSMLRPFGRLLEPVLNEFGVDAPPFPNLGGDFRVGRTFTRTLKGKTGDHRLFEVVGRT